MSFGESISTGLRNYVTFTGRASRSELWYFILFVVIASIVANLIDYFVFGTGRNGSIGIVSAIVSLALLLPSIAVEVRRLHDLDRSGWWLLLALIPLIGAIILIVWFCMPGTPGANRFGEPPQTAGRMAMAARM
jgi:uncharacterized membrane protein YhaH (DUF805 family)